jgi:regulation of enolase protein 1 (concanavalin A-like superfamily)
VIDPAGDCEFSESDGKVTISVPATHHDLNPSPQFDNVSAPRVLEDVEGDFVTKVKVDVFERPKAKTSSNNNHSFVAAGLVIWQDDKNFVRLMRAANGETGRLFVHLEVWADGQFQGDGYQDLHDKATYLRISRTKDQFSFAWSEDGKEWLVFAMGQLQIPKKLKVGVAAINSTTKQFKPEFQEFALQPKAD